MKDVSEDTQGRVVAKGRRTQPWVIIGTSLSFFLSCWGSAYLLNQYLFIIEADKLQPPSTIGSLWAGYVAGLGDFVFIAFFLWLSHVVTLLVNRGSIPHPQPIDLLARSTITGVLSFAVFGLCAALGTIVVTAFTPWVLMLVVIVTIPVPLTRYVFLRKD